MYQQNGVLILFYYLCCGMNFIGEINTLKRFVRIGTICITIDLNLEIWTNDRNKWEKN